MTLDKLLQLNIAELESMTSAQREEYFGPYLKFTRPELAAKEVPKAFAKKKQSGDDLMREGLKLQRLFKEKFGM